MIIDFNKYKKYLLKLPVEKLVEISNALKSYNKYYVYSDEKLRELLGIKPNDSLLSIYNKFRDLVDADLIDVDGEIITLACHVFTIDNRDYACDQIVGELECEFEDRGLNEFGEWFNSLNLGIDSPLNNCFKK